MVFTVFRSPKNTHSPNNTILTEKEYFDIFSPLKLFSGEFNDEEAFETTETILIVENKESTPRIESQLNEEIHDHKIDIKYDNDQKKLFRERQYLLQRLKSLDSEVLKDPLIIQVTDALKSLAELIKEISGNESYSNLSTEDIEIAQQLSVTLLNQPISQESFINIYEPSIDDTSMKFYDNLDNNQSITNDSTSVTSSVRSKRHKYQETAIIHSLTPQKPINQIDSPKTVRNQQKILNDNDSSEVIQTNLTVVIPENSTESLAIESKSPIIVNATTEVIEVTPSKPIVCVEGNEVITRRPAMFSSGLLQQLQNQRKLLNTNNTKTMETTEIENIRLKLESQQLIKDKQDQLIKSRNLLESLYDYCNRLSLTISILDIRLTKPIDPIENTMRTPLKRIQNISNYDEINHLNENNSGHCDWGDIYNNQMGYKLSLLGRGKFASVYASELRLKDIRLMESVLQTSYDTINGGKKTILNGTISTVIDYKRGHSNNYQRLMYMKEMLDNPFTFDRAKKLPHGKLGAIKIASFNNNSDRKSLKYFIHLLLFDIFYLYE